MSHENIGVAKEADAVKISHEEGDLNDDALHAISGGGFFGGIVGVVRAYSGLAGGVIGGAVRGAKESLGK
ncbi:hypothetical protein [Hyphomicrobium sp.]|uniref:hypothetical protein n=1 Tax=Hyphomicrobium sp. TaxID=82 RepID=UPI002BF99A79|nr:hypothetical protein [Hyphomicrobium sp.]HRN89631.1 hypothetical protein [Hyphomicrobium sp.]HRQ27562.1 hypothetical protein [Hyphomicrobium sp.]